MKIFILVFFFGGGILGLLGFARCLAVASKLNKYPFGPQNVTWKEFFGKK